MSISGIVVLSILATCFLFWIRDKWDEADVSQPTPIANKTESSAGISLGDQYPLGNCETLTTLFKSDLDAKLGELTVDQHQYVSFSESGVGVDSCHTGVIQGIFFNKESVEVYITSFNFFGFFKLLGVKRLSAYRYVNNKIAENICSSLIDTTCAIQPAEEVGYNPQDGCEMPGKQEIPIVRIWLHQGNGQYEDLCVYLLLYGLVRVEHPINPAIESYEEVQRVAWFNNMGFWNYKK